jgi:hypothetical protein
MAARQLAGFRLGCWRKAAQRCCTTSVFTPRRLETDGRMMDPQAGLAPQSETTEASGFGGCPEPSLKAGIDKSMNGNNPWAGHFGVHAPTATRRQDRPLRISVPPPVNGWHGWGAHGQPSWPDGLAQVRDHGDACVCSPLASTSARPLSLGPPSPQYIAIWVAIYISMAGASSCTWRLTTAALEANGRQRGSAPAGS